MPTIIRDPAPPAHQPSPAPISCQHQPNFPRLGFTTFRADNGQILRLCRHCGGAYPNAASVESGSGPDFNWELIRIGDKVAIRGSNGNYLSRCNNCWNGGVYPDSAFVHLNHPNEPYSQWTPIPQPNGRWAFQTDTGRYLARCQHCAHTWCTSNLAFVHVTNPSDPWAQWTLS